MKAHCLPLLLALALDSFPIRHVAVSQALTLDSYIQHNY